MKTFDREFSFRRHMENGHYSIQDVEQQRPRYDELVDDSPIFEHGCEVPECENCFRYFNSEDELRKHEEVKLLFVKKLAVAIVRIG